MNYISYNCCPWRHTIPLISKELDGEAVLNLEKAFFRGKLKEEEANSIFKGVIFLPDNTSRTVQLLYLTRIAGKEFYSPFTEEQERVFDISQRTDEAALNCLRCGCVVSCTASALALGVVRPGCFGPSWILETIAVLSTSIGAGVSYVSTGCYPHIASAKANEMQNTFVELKDLYLELGSHLITIYEYYPDQAKVLASGLDTGLIAKRCTYFLSENQAGDVVKSLEKAKAFILDGAISDTPLSIKNCVELFLLRKKLGTL